MTHEAKSKLIETKFDAFLAKLASELKTSTEDIECFVKNTLNHRDVVRDGWRSDRQAEIGR